jgi:hypothetical protein
MPVIIDGFAWRRRSGLAANGSRGVSAAVDRGEEAFDSAGEGLSIRKGLRF